MKSISKFVILLILSICVSGITGCESKQDHIAGNLEDIMAKVYASVPEDQLPMYLENMEVTKENVEGFLGTKDIDFEQALASESMVGSIAHSVVLIRMKDVKDVEDAKAKIKENINPRKWICVSAEKVTIESRGDLIIVILDDDNGDIILKDFQNLKAE